LTILAHHHTPGQRIIGRPAARRIPDEIINDKQLAAAIAQVRMLAAPQGVL
jgi:hypothetical protein